jgi:hypothetical protein
VRYATFLSLIVTTFCRRRQAVGTCVNSPDIAGSARSEGRAEFVFGTYPTGSEAAIEEDLPIALSAVVVAPGCCCVSPASRDRGNGRWDQTRLRRSYLPA